MPLDALDASVHGHNNELSCTSCHTGKARYRYPHEPLPESIQTAADYADAAIAATCTNCHYAHNPFHDEVGAATLDEGAALPNCLSCHGVHDVAAVEDIRDAMPERCTACHGEETAEGCAPCWNPTRVWAPVQRVTRACAVSVATRIATKAGCKTRHAQSVQHVAENPDAVIGDFTSSDAALTFGLEDVALTVGAVHQQKYITQTEDGNFYVLPAQWNVATEEWVPYQPNDWQEHEWRQNCSGCHVTGLDTETWEFTEFNIGCEDCHGPSLAHAQNPEEVKPYAVADDQVCGVPQPQQRTGRAPVPDDLPAGRHADRSFHLHDQ
ncbi:MAG: multiheme c-type cytochrome [Caldilineaceae bacterium]